MARIGSAAVTIAEAALGIFRPPRRGSLASCRFPKRTKATSRSRRRATTYSMQTVPAPGLPTIQLKVRSELSSGTPTGHLIAEISKRIGPAINTVAEYRALIEGLKLAHSRGIQRIRVFLDSELVVDRVNGRAKVRKEHIRPLHTEAWSLIQKFPNIRISWVPRKWNADADALATKALLDR